MTRGGLGEDQSGDVGAGDVGHTEQLLSQVGVQQAEGEGDDHKAALVPVIPLEPPLHQPVHDDPHHHADGEEGHDLHQNQQHVGAGARQAGDDGEGYDAQHVVNDGGAQDGVARTGGQLADLLQGLHGNAHRSGGEDHADEDVLQEGVAPLVEQGGQHKAAGQGDQHADEGDDEGGLAGLLQLAQIGLQTGVEHQHDDAQLRQLVHQGGLLQYAQHGGAQQQTGQQCAYHLGQGKPLGHNAQDLGAEQNDRDLK